MVEEAIARTLCTLLQKYNKNNGYIDDECLDDVTLDGTFDIQALVHDLIKQFEEYSKHGIS